MKKSLSELFDIIESVPYSVMFNVASGLSAFFRALQTDEALLQLVHLASESQGNLKFVQERIQILLHNNPESGYLSRYDVALAAYLLALEISGHPLNDMELTQLTSSDELWWAKRLAGRYLSERHPAPLEPTR